MPNHFFDPPSPALLRELKRTVEELAAFNEIGKALTSTLDIREVLRLIMAKVGELLRPENWSLLLLDEQTNELYFEAVVGDNVERIKDLRIKLGEGIAGWAAREGEPVLVANVDDDPRFSSRFDEVSAFRTTSVLAMPLRSRGRTLGVIELINGRTHSDFSGGFSEPDVRTLASIADYASIALENARNFQRLEELTSRDEHTGLFNARHLRDQLAREFARARRFGHGAALIFFDLDHFKQVNDTHGHQLGSLLLREIGQRLRQTLRTVDIACRYGGDEFVVLLPETDRLQAAAVARRLCDSFRAQAFLREAGLEVKVTASFGVAGFPEDAADDAGLVHAADVAMYLAKQGGRDRVCLVPARPRSSGAVGEAESPTPLLWKPPGE